MHTSFYSKEFVCFRLHKATGFLSVYDINRLSAVRQIKFTEINPSDK